MSNVTHLPPPHVREMLQPPELRRAVRQIDHWHEQAADNMARLGADNTDFDDLDRIAARLRERAEATYLPPAA